MSCLLPRDARASVILLSQVVRPSVCRSVCLSVMLIYREHIGWTSSKLLILQQIVCLGSLLLGATSSARGTPIKFGWNRGGVALLSRKPAISLKRGKIRPRLLLMTNRKSYTRFRLVPKSTTLDDSEGPLYIKPTLCFKTHASFGAHHENLNEERRTLSATTM